MLVSFKSSLRKALRAEYWEIEVMCAVFAGVWLLGIQQGLHLLR